MILIDLSQVMISNILTQVGSHTDVIEPGVVRHMILNTLRSLKNKFGVDYGELVIACDDKKYWRREVFPQYKANRKADREKSGIDWHVLFDTLNQIKQELKDNFPYRVIQVEGAEADDVIGALCFEFGTELNSDEQILILSGDKDFIQLQVFGNVQQYDFVRKKSVTAGDPDAYRERLVLTGDRGDGIPNVLSPDTCFIEGQRQKPLRENKILEILRGDTQPEDVMRNWHRNKTLIDLRHIPTNISKRIIAEYHKESGKGRERIFNYFIQHKMKMLTEHIGEF